MKPCGLGESKCAKGCVGESKCDLQRIFGVLLHWQSKLFKNGAVIEKASLRRLKQAMFSLVCGFSVRIVFPFYTLQFFSIPLYFPRIAPQDFQVSVFIPCGFQAWNAR